MGRAAECFKSSLKYNPYLWSSFENLCQLGDYAVNPLSGDINMQILIRVLKRILILHVRKRMFSNKVIMSLLLIFFILMTYLNDFSLLEKFEVMPFRANCLGEQHSHKSESYLLASFITSDKSSSPRTGNW